MQLMLTLDDLTVDFSHLKRARLLDDWRWLIGYDKMPVLITASGDAFLQDQSDRTVHFLNVCGGAISKVAETPDEFKSLLQQKSFWADHLASDMVLSLRSSGLCLKPGQIYSFKVPPVLGGEGSLENVEASDISVHFSIAGQLHAQICKVEAGTQVGTVSIHPPASKNKKWWWPFTNGWVNNRSEK
jgi:hypothetical protein